MIRQSLVPRNQPAQNTLPVHDVCATGPFLGVVVEEAQRCPTFRLVMGGRVEALLRGDNGQVRGVRYRARDGWHEVRAQLVVAADGRFSRVRSLAALEPVRRPGRSTCSGFDCLDATPTPHLEVFVSHGGWTVLHNRITDWQIGCTIAKGSYPRLHAEAIEAVRRPSPYACPGWPTVQTSCATGSRSRSLAVESSRLGAGTGQACC